MTHGFSFKGGFNYGVSRSLVEPSSTAGTSWGGSNPIVTDPNNPALAYSSNSPGKRVFVAGSYTQQYFSWGATTFSAFYDGHTKWTHEDTLLSKPETFVTTGAAGR